jgi:DNA-nicking Smr family endonuclease
MKAPLDVEDLRLWAVVTATVRPLRPSHPEPPVAVAPPPEPIPAKPPAPHRIEPPPKPPPRVQHGPAADVDAKLRRRLARGHDALAARIDLHGLTHDAARASLVRFVERSLAEGWRAVLVITGKGLGGDGLLRRLVPVWLAEPPLRAHVAGVSEAHRRHGGEGALYVALKRRHLPHTG